MQRHVSFVELKVPLNEMPVEQGLVLFPTRALPLTPAQTVVQTSVVVLWNWKEKRFLLLSRLLTKVATIVLKIAVMIMYHSLKFSSQLGWVAQYLEVCKAAAKNAGTCSLLGFPAATAPLSDRWHHFVTSGHRPCHGTHPLCSGTLWISAAHSELAELLPYGPNTHKVWHGLRKMCAETQTCAGGGGENSKRFLTGPRRTRRAQLVAAL